jgi:maltooligosyltrehalose trehalohydrolase
MGGGSGTYETIGPAALRVAWRLGDGSVLQLLANLGKEPVRTVAGRGASLFSTAPEAAWGALGPWSVAWTLAVKEGRP